jgi:hypothetical protein
MAASSGFMIAEAERRFPVRIRIGIPPDGLGSRLDRIKVWLDESCGASQPSESAKPTPAPRVCPRASSPNR